MRIILTILFLYFIFHGQPDIFDLVHQKVVQELKRTDSP